jgi:Chaperone of endosialidase
VVNEKGYVMNAKNFRGFLVAAIVITSGLSVLAANSITKILTIPFTFAAGKPIKASDLNANFSAVKKTLENHDHAGESWNYTGAGRGLSIYSSATSPALLGSNGIGDGVVGFAYGKQAGGVKGINNNGVGVWGQSYSGNGGYFSTQSNTFPALAIRQYGSHHLIDAYGPGDSVPAFSVYGDGTLTTKGTIYSRGIALTSDRNAKKNFSSIDPQNVLEKVAAMPITRWNYKADASSVAHVGPMAQDFHAAFGLNGTDDKHISVIDEQGIALAAIQGLNQKLESTNAALKAENAKLRSSLTDLEKRLAALEHK